MSARRKARTQRNRSRAAANPVPGAGQHLQRLFHQSALHEFRTRPYHFHAARPLGTFSGSAFSAWNLFGARDSAALIVAIELLQHGHGGEGWTLVSLLTGISIFGLSVAGQLRD